MDQVAHQDEHALLGHQAAPVVVVVEDELQMGKVGVKVADDDDRTVGRKVDQASGASGPRWRPSGEAGEGGGDRFQNGEALGSTHGLVSPPPERSFRRASR